MPNNQDSPRFNIPENITREHIIQAIKEIDIQGYSEKNASRKYDLLYNGKRYPPKVIISLANKFANGIVLDVSEFSGGEQFTNKFLKERDFEIALKEESNPVFEYESYSWNIVPNQEACKKTDRSVFLHHGTGIPIQIRSFFGITDLKPGDKTPITLWYRNNRYDAHLEMTSHDSPRSRMMWRSDFSTVLQSTYQKWFNFFHEGGVESDDTPSIKFVKRQAANEYDIDFVEASPIEQGVNLGIPDKVILTKYQEYSREDVHNIFDKNSRYTPRSGKWGLRGIITHPKIKNDFIFFVTFGHKESGFSFNEYVTKTGILTWQSEPKQKLKVPIIQKLITHDATKNNIDLFLRTNEDRRYTYLGRLAYISHDPTREQPVHFTWKILDWNLGADKAKEIGLELQPDGPGPLKNSDNTTTFIQTPPPDFKPIVRDSKLRTFKGRKTDHAARNQQNTDIGDAGEFAAIEIEKAILRKADAEKLIEKIEHVAKTQGDGLGFDIQSITPEGETKLIEVKTTVNGKSEPFILTDTEFIRSKQDAKNYYLYRIYDFEKSKSVVTYYVIKGDLTNQTFRDPIQYSCVPISQHSIDTNYTEYQ